MKNSCIVRDRFPLSQIGSSCRAGNGILALDDTAIDHYLDVWDEYLASNPTIVKFVPASGAASRMSKFNLNSVDADYTEPTTEFEK